MKTLTSALANTRFSTVERFRGGRSLIPGCASTNAPFSRVHAGTDPPCRHAVSRALDFPHLHTHFAVEVGIGSQVEKIFIDGSSVPSWQVIADAHGSCAEQVILGFTNQSPLRLPCRNLTFRYLRVCYVMDTSANTACNQSVRSARPEVKR